MIPYFFVPADKIRKIPEIKQKGISTIVIDLEDAVKSSLTGQLAQDVIQKVDKESFVRLPLYNLETGNLDTALLSRFVVSGFKNFIFPKLNTTKELENLLSLLPHKDFKIIVLIETPKFYLDIQKNIFDFEGRLFGLGLGSHDFMAHLGAKHTLKNLEQLRNTVIYMASACSMEAIDIASMELNDMDSFKNEVLDGFDKGYTAKFLIHPKQWEVLKSIHYYTQEEVAKAHKILERLQDVGTADEFNALIIDGEIIEKPHIDRAKRIVENTKNI